MSTGALIMMIVVLGIVWGGVGLALLIAWRQERRAAAAGAESPEDDESAT